MAAQNIEWQRKFPFLIVLYLIREVLLKAYCELGCQPPTSKTPPLLSCQGPPLNLQNVQASPAFLGNSPLHIVFFVGLLCLFAKFHTIYFQMIFYIVL